MAQSKCSNSETRGFTLAEVCVSIAVLTIGLVAAAAMFGKVWGSTAYSEYMIQASTLASEKLEDLNRYPNGDPNVAVPNGTSAGSLTSDLDATVTSNGVTETVDYFDEVFISAASGSVSETVATGTSPNYVYTTTTHNPNGTIGPVAGTTFPANSIQFERRWILENNPVVGGVTMTSMLRITVLVTVINSSVQPPVTFQMSLVRP
jgi:prepilin-type N-terminal cleavage/methylation domain-containing protein